MDLDRLPTDSPPPRSLSVLTYVPWLLMCVVLLASWVGGWCLEWFSAGYDEPCVASSLTTQRERGCAVCGRREGKGQK